MNVKSLDLTPSSPYSKASRARTAARDLFHDYCVAETGTAGIWKPTSAALCEELHGEVDLRCFFVSSPLNTICLQAVHSDGRPIGLGSGCLIRVDHQLVLVGVQHVVDNAKRWCIHLRVIPGRGSELYGFGTPTYFKLFAADNAEPLNLDFFAVVVPGNLQPVYEEVRGLHAISDPIPKRIFLLSDIALPQQDERYSFFGAVAPIESGAFLEIKPQSEENMTFVEARPEHLVFQLAGSHKGDAAYKGCSGAPIVDSNDRLVALVISGCESANLIFGVPLRHYQSSIAATAMEDSRGK